MIGKPASSAPFKVVCALATGIGNMPAIPKKTRIAPAVRRILTHIAFIAFPWIKMKKAAIPDDLSSGFSGFAASPALGDCLHAASTLTPSDGFPVTSFVPILRKRRNRALPRKSRSTCGDAPRALLTQAPYGHETITERPDRLRGRVRKSADRPPSPPDRP